MAYIGTPPSNAFTSLLKQDFSTSATTGYTLDHAVNNANDIALFINFVRQEPTAGYAASGTTLTLTSATASSDDMYCVYLGQALQTVNPANASVGAAQLVDSSIALGKLSATGTKNATTFLRGDNTFASAGGNNTPAFRAYLGSNQNININTNTKININTENFDTDNCYDNSSNYRFTPNVAGKYFVYAQLAYSSTVLAMRVKAGLTMIYKNGSELIRNVNQPESSSGSNYSNQFTLSVQTVVEMNGSSDYLEVYALEDVGTDSSNAPKIGNGDNQSYFGAYKIIE